MANSISRNLCSGLILLAIAFVLYLFSNGNWTISLAAWLAPVFLIRFIRIHKLAYGFGIGFTVYVIALLIAWHGISPYTGILNYIYILIYGFVLFIPFMADRVLSVRLTGFKSTLIFPLAWTCIEYLESLVGPYGTWGSIAYTQTNNLYLLQIVSVTGMWGLAFLISWFASIINWIWAKDFQIASIRKGIGIYLPILLIILIGGAVRLSQSQPALEIAKIASITKDPEISRMIGKAVYLDDYLAISDECLKTFLEKARLESAAGAKIIFGQERAVPFVGDEKHVLEQARDMARQGQIYLGLPYSTLMLNEQGQPASPGEPAFLPQNKFVLIDPSGEIIIDYSKLKPAPAEDIQAGTRLCSPAETPYGKIAAVICFDSAFPDLVRRTVTNYADILLVPAQDWASSVRIVNIRAIENGVAVVRSTERGLSIAVDCYGRVLAIQDYYQSDYRVMISHVPIKGRTTIYSSIGDIFAWLAIGGFLLMAGLAVFSRREG